MHFLKFPKFQRRTWIAAVFVIQITKVYQSLQIRFAYGTAAWNVQQRTKWKMVHQVNLPCHACTGPLRLFLNAWAEWETFSSATALQLGILELHYMVTLPWALSFTNGQYSPPHAHLKHPHSTQLSSMATSAATLLTLRWSFLKHEKWDMIRRKAHAQDIVSRATTFKNYTKCTTHCALHMLCCGGMLYNDVLVY